MADCLYKRPIQLKEPIQSKDRWIYEISVPCGQCSRCIERRKMEWAFRIGIELGESKTAYFVTLTYNNENVPITQKGLKTLTPHKDVTHLVKLKGKNRRVRRIRDDLQLFFKRLRQNHKRSPPTIETLIYNLKPTDKIRFYAAAEYGELRHRPHYHAIIFNTSVSAIEKSWTLGDTHIVKANRHTIAYVMKYLDKRLDHKQDKRKTLEYNTMSEGLGESYIAKNIHWHKQNLDILFVSTITGIKIPMPRYYREKLFTEDERKYQVLIVEERLSDKKKEDIRTLGQELYNQKISQERKFGEDQFRKKATKRNMD